MTDQSPLVTFDPEMVSRHLDLLYSGTEGFVPVRLLQEKDGAEVRNVLPFEPIGPDLLTRVLAHVTRAASLGAGTFVVPGTVDKTGSAKASDVVQMACLLVDLDKGDVAAARAHLEAHIGQPSMIVASGGITEEGQPRLHLYWRLAEVVSGAGLKHLCKLRGLLADKVGGDTAFASAHQPIRLAGSIYAKSRVRKLVRIIEQVDAAYHLSDLDRAVKSMPVLEGLPALPFTIDTGRKGPSVAELQVTRIRSDGRDEVTRFEAIGKVAGHWIRQVRTGRITLDEAWDALEEHNAAAIDPPWETAKLRQSFDAILKRDLAEHGPMPQFQVLIVPDDLEDGLSEGKQAPLQAITPADAVFLSDDDLADRFVERSRNELRFVPARGA